LAQFILTILTRSYVFVVYAGKVPKITDIFPVFNDILSLPLFSLGRVCELKMNGSTIEFL